MTVRRLEAEPPPNPRLDRYRNGGARVLDQDGVLVAHLATRAQVWWTTVGPFWRRRGVDPVERPEWLMTFAPAVGGRFGTVGFGDGVVQDVEGEIDDWDANRFRLMGEVLQLEWLDSAEAQVAWAKYGWG